MTTCDRRGFIQQAGALTAVASFAQVLAACGGDDGNGAKGDTSTLARARKEGSIRIGIANEAPFGFVDKSGELTGEAATLAQEILRQLGIPKVDAVITEFGALVPGLMASRFDVISAGMFITPDRCESVIFSEPDVCLAQALGVAKGNPHQLVDYQDIADNDDVKLGVVSGGVEPEQAKALGVPSSRTQVFPDGPTAADALKVGRIDAVALTSAALKHLLKNVANTEVAAPFFPVIDGKKQFGCSAFAFRDSDPELRDAVNRELIKLKRDKPEELVNIGKPFGYAPKEYAAAQDVTTEQLCEQG
jgi:polar amino acid transport system substrate-binding protein